MNFEFSIHAPGDGGKWGEEVEPGVFTGLVGELKKESADIAWANLFIQPHQLAHIDYTQSHAIDYVCYIVNLTPITQC